MTKREKGFMDWATFHNAASIIFSLISTTIIITLYFSQIKTELALIKQRQDQEISLHVEASGRDKIIEMRLDNVEKGVTEAVMKKLERK